MSVAFVCRFISALGITFLSLCEESYPKVLAFCFLDEVQKEFIVRYDNFKISSVKRPYAFIEYGESVHMNFLVPSHAQVCEMFCTRTCWFDWE